MWTRSLSLILLATTGTQASAVPLAPHRAVYDLSLAEQSRDLQAVEGRIALGLSVEGCEDYALDYRFVARFGAADELTLTDQRIEARERRDGSLYEFDTWTFVDGIEQSRVEGNARQEGGETRIDMLRPVQRSLAIRTAHFPLSHTRHLIERARAGDRIVESPLYDGDADGENLLSTTAILAPLPDTGRSARHAGIRDLAAWQVDESYYNDESEADGTPIFHTRYTLYENGVTDDLYMDFGNYKLEGALTELTLPDAPADCR